MTVEQAGVVLDASALLAYPRDESGSQLVQAALAARAGFSAVKYAEVLSRLNDVGEDPEMAHRRLRAEGLIGGLLEIVALSEEDATVIARLRAGMVCPWATAPALPPAFALAGRWLRGTGPGRRSTWACPCI